MTRHEAPVAVGGTFTQRVTFDAASIRAFATLSGDNNPLHHDDAAGAASPFGTIIASGPHVVALMMGLDARSSRSARRRSACISTSASCAPFRRKRS